MSTKDIVQEILKRRGISPKVFNDFLNPDYAKKHNPFLLPDMNKAVERIKKAHTNQDKITIYGDYDIDGITATALLLESLEKFGFKHLDHYLPNRFTDGYGMNKAAVKKIADSGTELIITVDCGSLNHEEIDYAKTLGVDVVVTDHHNIADTKPNAVAVVNPKYQLKNNPGAYKNNILIDSEMNLYPFMDLCGVGVAFKLVQALQTELDGMAEGQEKWLLDLVALGTVCDSVSLMDENRANVHWGIKVMSKQHRPGVKALLNVSGSKSNKINARTLGFALGPRLNAAGRLRTADEALALVRSKNHLDAIKKANDLDKLNTARRSEQDQITKQAKELAEKQLNDSVLILSNEGWNQGIIGIVASKIMEYYKKPTFMISVNETEAVGSARSFGDFSVANAIHYAKDHILRGGGHKVAAGVTLQKNKIEDFRSAVNKYYEGLGLAAQEELLFPDADLEVALDTLSIELAEQILKLEPFGVGNPEPVFYSENVVVENVRAMGNEGQHLKLTVNQNDKTIDLLSFNAPKNFFVDSGATINVWYTIEINEWNGRRELVGHVIRLKLE